MDINRKKELMEAYKNRRPEMGVVSVRCLATGESFLGASSDTRATMNGIRVKLNGGLYPNRPPSKSCGSSTGQRNLRYQS